MNSAVPKQFLKLDGQPVLMHTMRRFAEADKSIKIILVLQKDQFNYWSQLCRDFSFDIPHSLCEGGEARFYSVKNGLELIEEKDNTIVAIHDAVRPLVSKKTITEAFETASIKGNAIPVVPLNDSLRQITEDGSVSVDRNRFFLVQTPQCFSFNIIRSAYKTDFRETFTDDASVVEADGVTINLVPGNQENIKITSPADLHIGEALIKNISNDASF